MNESDKLKIMELVQEYGECAVDIAAYSMLGEIEDRKASSKRCRDILKEVAKILNK